MEDGLLGKYLVNTPKKSKLCKKINKKGLFLFRLTKITKKKSKLKILQMNFCLSKKLVVRKLLVQKTGRTGHG